MLGKDKESSLHCRQRGEVLLQEATLSQNICDPLSLTAGIPSAQREDNSWTSKRAKKIKTDVVFPGLTSPAGKNTSGMESAVVYTSPYPK